MVGVVLALLGYYVIYPHIFYCQTIRFSEFNSVGDRMYVSPAISPAQASEMMEVVARAEKRVEEFLGEQPGSATLILCNDSEEYQKYCHSNEGAGCSLGTPLGDSYIILNPYGLNEDVVSHEMCHATLLTHLGWWTTTAEIPQWFNEGLALMLDHRFVAATDSIQRYVDYKEEWLYLTRGGQELLELDDIESMKGFFGGNQKRVMLAYMTSGMEVSHWLAIAGRQGIQELTKSLEQGIPFEEAYKTIAGKGSARLHAPLKEHPFRL